ncbi:MAG: dihydrofolate reductase family protein [Lachnospiraceae bacterium]
MAIPKVEFNEDVIRLKRLFDNTKKMGYVNDGLVCEKVDSVYGKLMFGEVPTERPITYASYVMSVDGKIAFEDNEVGPMIAKTNHLDDGGAFADFWILNLLRANCDGIIIGSGTLIKEPDYSGSAYDPDLLEARIKNGKSIAPWTVVVTTTGKRIPFGNEVFSQEEIPVLIATSPEGYENLKEEITKEYFELPLIRTEDDKKIIAKLLKENKGKVAVLVTGQGKNTNSVEMMKVLRAMGMEKVLVESPTYCHHVMQEELLDEIFINTSCVFVGGQATGIGTASKSFPSTDHPHSEIVTMHMHSPHFIYTRYKMIYGVK